MSGMTFRRTSHGARTGKPRVAALAVVLAVAAFALTACSSPARGSATYSGRQTLNAGLGAAIPLGRPGVIGSGAAVGTEQAGTGEGGTGQDSSAGPTTSGPVNAGLGAGIPLGGAPDNEAAPTSTDPAPTSGSAQPIPGVTTGAAGATVSLTGAATLHATVETVLCVTNAKQLAVSITGIDPAFAASITMTPTSPHRLLAAGVMLGNYAAVQPGKPPVSYGVNGPTGSGPQQSTLTQLASGSSPTFHLVGPVYANDPTTGAWLTAHLDITATCGGVAAVTN